jgi:hypothetical protein
METTTDAYRWLAERECRPANQPQDLSQEWDELTPVSDASDVARDRIRSFVRTKGTSFSALVGMDARFRETQRGNVTLGYAVRCAETDGLSAGTVVGIKFRDLALSQKFCASGTKLGYPALPSLYGASDPRRLFVCEGETDAAWLLDRCDVQDAVFCLHGGAALFCPKWLDHLPEAGEVFVATDNDWGRSLGNIGDELAGKFLKALPDSRRLRPPFPAKDWCEVSS